MDGVEVKEALQAAGLHPSMAQRMPTTHQAGPIFLLFSCSRVMRTVHSMLNSLVLLNPS
jgi:hypothetical protein